MSLVFLALTLASLPAFCFAQNIEPSLEADSVVVESIEKSGQAVSTKTMFGSKLVCVRSQDEVWVVSARQDQGCGLSCQVLAAGTWQERNIHDLVVAHSTDTELATVVYVHGNLTNDEYARSRGLQVYENLFNPSCEECISPTRFVIFAWRSEREKVRLGSDYLVKLERSAQLGPRFGDFLNRFDDRNMLLLGFSLGGQMILSGLAEQDGCGFEDKPGQYQVALITPAIDPMIESNLLDSITCNPQVGQAVAYVNRNDAALKASKILTKGRGLQDGLSLDQLANKSSNAVQLDQLRVEDITAEVSSCHSITKYSESSHTFQAGVICLANLSRASFGAAPVKISESADAKASAISRTASLSSSNSVAKK